MAKLWTVKSLLACAIGYFEELGLERPRLETELLLSSSLKKDRLWLYTNYDLPLKESEIDLFRSVVKRRAKREPLQYILGHWGFWSLDFEISPGVLIPRKESEHLVEYTIKSAKPGDKILDLCTGCGNIVVSLANELQKVLLWATDISPAALKIARRNAQRYNVSDRIEFLMGDLFEPFVDREIFFDIIICNPPYIPTKDMNTLQPEVRDFEPEVALNGGDEGLSFYRRLIPEALSFLKPMGFLVMEIGKDQAASVGGMLKDIGYKDIDVIKDYAGLNRVIAGRR